MIQLRSNPGPTGRMIHKMLAARGLLTGEVKGVVNYGYGGPTPLPCLNRRAGMFNKLQELELLHAKGVATIPFSVNHRDLVCSVATPLLGRSLHHTRGNDITLYRIQPDVHVGLGRRVRHDFFTQLIPKVREFRVWAFRRKCIGIYEKILTYPKKQRRARSSDIWNWRAGYGYHFMHPSACPEALKSLGTASVDAVGLDFGAVDVIEGRDDGRYYVLEINSAPGTQGPRQGVSSLVNHIERWARGGFLKRNGEESA